MADTRSVQMGQAICAGHLNSGWGRGRPFHERSFPLQPIPSVILSNKGGHVPISKGKSQVTNQRWRGNGVFNALAMWKATKRSEDYHDNATMLTRNGYEMDNLETLNYFRT
ncbi:hypothetical protein J6590_036988 [Homalodisca vitripennis]|nr:hypothetical protein J6590_036988 [Homalodisca vitripennis]